jgi:hypothetical protein
MPQRKEPNSKTQQLNNSTRNEMYAKVFAQIYDGTLCTNGPWQALVTFQQMLVLADQEGNVDMTASAIARRTTIPLEIIELGLLELCKADPESRTPNLEGRRIVPLSEGRSWGWSIVNYKRYRDLKREEDRRQYHKDYWHKRKPNDSTPLNTTQHDSTRLNTTQHDSTPLNTTQHDSTPLNTTQHHSTDSTKSTEAEAEAKEKNSAAHSVLVPSAPIHHSNEPIDIVGEPAGCAVAVESVSTTSREVDVANSHRVANASPAKKGSRLPNDWYLPKTWGEWALSEMIGWTVDDVRTQSAMFADYWQSKPGADAAKLDWLKTWRNWCRRAKVGSGQMKSFRQQDRDHDRQRTKDMCGIFGEYVTGSPGDAQLNDLNTVDSNGLVVKEKRTKRLLSFSEMMEIAKLKQGDQQ